VDFQFIKEPKGKGKKRIYWAASQHIRMISCDQKLGEHKFASYKKNK